MCIVFCFLLCKALQQLLGLWVFVVCEFWLSVCASLLSIFERYYYVVSTFCYDCLVVRNNLLHYYGYFCSVGDNVVVVVFIKNTRWSVD